jgi:hypothetical protein
MACPEVPELETELRTPRHNYSSLSAGVVVSPSSDFRGGSPARCLSRLLIAVSGDIDTL